MHRVTKRTWIIHVFLLILLLGMGFFLWEYMTEAQCNFIVVGTKCDKLNRTERNAFEAFMQENMPEVPYILYSAKSGEGREELWKKITEAVLD